MYTVTEIVCSLYPNLSPHSCCSCHHRLNGKHQRSTVEFSFKVHLKSPLSVPVTAGLQPQVHTTMTPTLHLSVSSEINPHVNGEIWALGKPTSLTYLNHFTTDWGWSPHETEWFNWIWHCIALIKQRHISSVFSHRQWLHPLFWI